MNHKKYLLARPPEAQSHSRNKVTAVKVRSTTTEVHIGKGIKSPPHKQQEVTQVILKEKQECFPRVKKEYGKA